MTKIENLRQINSTLLPYRQILSTIHGGYALAVAMCYQESKGDKWSFNYEPNFRKNLVDPLKINSEKQFEIVFRSTSWGLFQIMGQVIRENNVQSKIFIGRPMQAEEFMMDTDEQIKLYVKIMDKNKKRYHSTIDAGNTMLTDIIAAYNAGSAKRTIFGKYKNQEYVDSVTQHMTYIKANIPEIN